MPRKATGASDAGSLRQFLAEVMEENATKDAVREVVMAALGASATTVVECPRCSNSFKAKLPDMKKAIDVMTAILEQVEGRPEQRMPEATTVVLQRVTLAD